MTNVSFTTSSGKRVRFRARHQRRHLRRTRYGIVVAGKGFKKFKKNKVYVIGYLPSNPNKTEYVVDATDWSPEEFKRFIGIAESRQKYKIVRT